MINGSIFKAYDIRGLYPGEINEDVAAKVVAASMVLYPSKQAILARDGRLSSPDLASAVAESLIKYGAEVLEIGLATADQFYYSVKESGAGLGFYITASHNPPEYNGIKIVGPGAEAFRGDDQILNIKKMVIEDKVPLPNSARGRKKAHNTKKAYIEKLKSNVDLTGLAGRRLVIDPGNGMTALYIDDLFSGTGAEVIKICDEIDPFFTCRGPNPIEPGALEKLSAKVVETGSSLGLAFDSDGDRLVAVSDNGEIIKGDYLTALLSQYVLKKRPGSGIVHDVRAFGVVEDAIRSAGGIPIISRVGHSYIKAMMKAAGAVFAGENSGHFYSSDFHYFDSGLLAALMLLEVVSAEGATISELLKPLTSAYFLSGELNFKTDKSEKIIEALKARFSEHASELDGLRVVTPALSFSLRPSNTEPLLRLNIEARSQEDLDQAVSELSAFITDFK